MTQSSTPAQAGAASGGPGLDLTGKVVALPAREDIDCPIEEHLIVELYSR